MTHSTISRRAAIATLAALGSGAVLAQGVASRPATVRLGYQKSSTLIAVLKTQGVLEKQLAPLNVTLSWHEFTSGLPLLEALNLDNLPPTLRGCPTVPRLTPGPVVVVMVEAVVEAAAVAVEVLEVQSKTSTVQRRSNHGKMWSPSTSTRQVLTKQKLLISLS